MSPSRGAPRKQPPTDTKQPTPRGRSPRLPRPFAGGPTLVQPPWNARPAHSAHNEKKPRQMRLFFDDDVGPPVGDPGAYVEWMPPLRMRKDGASAAVDWAAQEPPARIICVPDAEPVESEEEQRYVTPSDGPKLAAIVLAVQNEKKIRLESKRKRREEAVKRMTPGAREVYRFREFLIKKFGNLVRGWVLVFDRDKSGSVTRKEFFAALNEIKYPSDPQVLWRRIDKDHSGTMTLSELAPKSSDEIADFKHWARRKFGGMREALIGMDKDRNGKLNFAEFNRACGTYGFVSDHLKLIFQCMDVDGAGSIEADEVKWLDKWDPPHFLYYEPDLPQWTSFKQLLVERNRNNAILAWRKSLDRDSSMRVNYDEFSRACKRMKVEKMDPPLCIASMWRALDRNLSGWISMREFDPTAFELLGGLKCWAISTFGSLSQMFYAFDTSNGGDLSWKEFSTKLVSYCADYDLDVDITEIQYLFNGLDLDGKKKLTPDELEFLDDWDLALDLEEEQVFPHFRLWSTGDETKAQSERLIAAEAAEEEKSPEEQRREAARRLLGGQF